MFKLWAPTIVRTKGLSGGKIVVNSEHSSRITIPRIYELVLSSPKVHADSLLVSEGRYEEGSVARIAPQTLLRRE